MSSNSRKIHRPTASFLRFLPSCMIAAFIAGVPFSSASLRAEEKDEPIFVSPLGDDSDVTVPVTNRPEPKPINTADPLGPAKAPADQKAADPKDSKAADAKAPPVTALADTVVNQKGVFVSQDDAIEYAVLNNLGLKIARLNDRGSDINVRVAWSVYYPEFNVGVTHSGTRPTGGRAESGTTLTGGFTQRSPWGTQLDFAMSETHNNSFNSKDTVGNSSVRLSQPLWKGFGTDVGLADIRTARINRLISRGNLELQVQQLIFSIRTAYADIIRQIQSHDVNVQAVRSAKTFLDLTSARLEAGQQTKLDLFNAEVQLRSRELDLIRTDRALETAYDRLKQLMDVDLTQDLKVDAPIVDFGEETEKERADKRAKENARTAALEELGKPARERARKAAQDAGKTDTEANEAAKAAEEDATRALRAKFSTEDKAQPLIEKRIVSDNDSGTVSVLIIKDGQVTESKLLFQATRFDADVIMKEALDNRIDLLISSRQLAVQRIQTLLAKDGLGYQIDLVSTYNRSHNQRSFFESDNGLEGNNWSVGVNAAIPWGKIRDRAAYERALLDLERTEIELKQVRTQVQFDIRDNLRNLREAEKSLLIEGQRVEQSKRSVEAARISFERGLKDSFDVIRAEDDLLAAKTSFITRKLDYVIQLARIEVVVGKPTGRVDLSGQSVGGLIDAHLPPEFRDNLPRAQPEPEKRQEQDPFNKTREYRKDYKPNREGPKFLDEGGEAGRPK